MARKATAPTRFEERLGGRDSGADDHDGVPGREHRDRAEPVGEPAADRSHEHRDHDEAGHPVGGVRRAQPVGGLQVRRQVDRERDVATERHCVEEAGLPGDREPCVGREAGHQRRGRGRPGRGRPAGPPTPRRRRRRAAAAVIRNGALGPTLVKSFTVVSALIAVPPMPAPKIADRQATALRREPRVHERHTHREGGARDAQEEAADQQQGVRVQREERDEEDRDDGHGRDDREHHPSAELVGERAHDDAAQRTHDHRDGDEQCDIGLGEGAQRNRCRGTAVRAG